MLTTDYFFSAFFTSFLAGSAFFVAFFTAFLATTTGLAVAGFAVSAAVAVNANNANARVTKYFMFSP